MRPKLERHGGFTLIELMISVAIVGVLASVALPTYNRYMMAAKATEIPQNLHAMYLGSATYWDRGFTQEKGVTAASNGHCVVNTCCHGSSFPPLPPVPYKRFPDWNSEPQLAGIGFAPSGGVFGVYAIAAPGEFAGVVMGSCGHTESEFDAVGGVVYQFVGAIDLNGDGKIAGSVLPVGIRNGELFRAPAFMTVQDAFGGPACPFCAPGFVD